MIIQFTSPDEPSTRPLTFGRVEPSQFFIREDGALCQKVEDSIYAKIAQSDGTPQAQFFTDISSDLVINSELPVVERIEF